MSAISSHGDVTDENEKVVWHTLYDNHNVIKNVKYTFNVGDQVRISKIKRQFEKGYVTNFSKEIFVVSKQIPRDPPVYKLKDYGGEVRFAYSQLDYRSVPFPWVGNYFKTTQIYRFLCAENEFACWQACKPAVSPQFVFNFPLLEIYIPPFFTSSSLLAGGSHAVYHCCAKENVQNLELYWAKDVFTRD